MTRCGWFICCIFISFLPVLLVAVLFIPESIHTIKRYLKYVAYFLFFVDACPLVAVVIFLNIHGPVKSTKVLNPRRM